LAQSFWGNCVSLRIAPSSIPSPHENLIIGGGVMDIEGIMYFPSERSRSQATTID